MLFLVVGEHTVAGLSLIKADSNIEPTSSSSQSYAPCPPRPMLVEESARCSLFSEGQNLADKKCERTGASSEEGQVAQELNN